MTLEVNNEPLTLFLSISAFLAFPCQLFLSPHLGSNNYSKLFSAPSFSTQQTRYHQPETNLFSWWTALAIQNINRVSLLEGNRFAESPDRFEESRQDILSFLLQCRHPDYKLLRATLLARQYIRLCRARVCRMRVNIRFNFTGIERTSGLPPH